MCVGVYTWVRWMVCMSLCVVVCAYTYDFMPKDA